MANKVTVADLRNQLDCDGRLMRSRANILYCRLCGAEYSAHADDYFLHPASHVFKCCGRNMLLVMKQTTYKVVNG